MHNPPSRRAWLIPGLVAAILFVGAVASNLIASYLETTVKPYSRWVWIMFAIALVVAVATAIVEARRRDRPPVSNAAAATTRIVNASGERSVAVGDKVDGDANFRDKITCIRSTGRAQPRHSVA